MSTPYTTPFTNPYTPHPHTHFHHYPFADYMPPTHAAMHPTAMFPTDDLHAHHHGHYNRQFRRGGVQMGMSDRHAEFGMQPRTNDGEVEFGYGSAMKRDGGNEVA